MLGKPDLEAEITFLTTEAGGRKGYAVSGYRPQLYYRGEDHDAVQQFVGKDRVYPGETATVRLDLLHPELFVGRIVVGDDFDIREGHRIVAHGRVTRILNLVENGGATQQIVGREPR